MRVVTISKRALIFCATAALLGALVYGPFSETARSVLTPLIGSPVRRGPSVPGLVALTFDDGPDPQNTPFILEVLSRYQAKATFFVVGEWVDKHPDLVRQAAAAGHQIASHSYSHRNVAGKSMEQIRGEIQATEDAVFKAAGVRPNCFRPPYGRLNSRMLQVLVDKEYGVVLWSLDSLDWKLGSAAQIANLVVQEAKPGDIVLMHDGGGPRPRTIKALDTILRQLSAKGFHFVTLDELFQAQAASDTGE